jgi:hypothetical protein
MTDPTPAHPVLVAVAARADELFTRVEAREVHAHDAMAVLIADTLGIGVDPDLEDQVADQLLNMVSDWALRRRRALQADLQLSKDPVPDDASDLDSGPGQV